MIQNRIQRYWDNHHEGKRYIPMDELPDYQADAYREGVRHGSAFWTMAAGLGWIVGFLFCLVVA